MEQVASTRPLASTWRFFFLGIVMAIAATVVTGALTSLLFDWGAQRIDPSLLSGGGDGHEAALLQILNAFLLLLAHAGPVPLVYSDHRRVNNRAPIVAWRLALIGATLASLPSIAFGLRYGLLYCLFLSAPMILSTTVGLLVLTRIANRELTR